MFVWLAQIKVMASKWATIWLLQRKKITKEYLLSLSLSLSLSFCSYFESKLIIFYSNEISVHEKDDSL